MDCSFEGIGHMRVTFPDGGCTEGKMTCGKAAEVREKYRKIREEMSK